MTASRELREQTDLPVLPLFSGTEDEVCHLQTGDLRQVDARQADAHRREAEWSAAAGDDQAERSQVAARLETESSEAEQSGVAPIQADADDALSASGFRTMAGVGNAGTRRCRSQRSR